MSRPPRPTFSAFTLGNTLYPMSASQGPDLADAGYSTSEWAMSGEAVSYSTDVVPADGRVELAEADSAPFATRLLVRRPRPEQFSGVVLVEWLNVSGGQDASPQWTYTAEEIMRAGHVWIGVSAQYIAVEGGGAAVGVGGQTEGLRAQRPERYDVLHHPGDAYAFDIVTQVGRYARELGGDEVGPEAPDNAVSARPGDAASDGAGDHPDDASPDSPGPLDDLRPTAVLALGESQSAFALTSYVNGVHPVAGVFDGFLLHSRGAGTLPYDDYGRGSDITEVLTNTAETGSVRLRDDLSTPVMVVQAEGDLGYPLHSARARQPDTDHLVTWEVAGQAHADAYLIGEFAQFVDCGGPINNGQQVFVMRAALRHLVSWADGGERPPSAPAMELGDDEVVPGDLGVARGGVRTPAVEAPVETLIGASASGADPLCMLLGRTVEVPQAELSERWSGRGEYLEAYRDATDRLIAEGFLLPEDRDAILADVRAERLAEQVG